MLMKKSDKIEWAEGKELRKKNVRIIQQRVKNSYLVCLAQIQKSTDPREN